MRPGIRRFMIAMLALVMTLFPASAISGEEYGVRPKYRTLYVGERESLNPYGFPDYRFSWSSAKALSIDKNLNVTALAVPNKNPVTIQITSKDGKRKVSTSITVRNPHFAIGRKIYEKQYSMKTGQTVTADFVSNGIASRSWSISSRDVLKPQTMKNGRYTMKALKAGTAYLTVTYAGRNYRQKFVVKDPPKPTPTPTPKPKQVFQIEPAVRKALRVARFKVTSNLGGTMNATVESPGAAQVAWGDSSGNEWPLYIIGKKNTTTKVAIKNNSKGNLIRATATFTGMKADERDCRSALKDFLLKRSCIERDKARRFGDSWEYSVQWDKQKTRFVFRAFRRDSSHTGKVRINFTKGFTRGSLYYEYTSKDGDDHFRTYVSIDVDRFKRNDRLKMTIQDNNTDFSESHMVAEANEAKDKAFFLWNILLADHFGLDLQGVGFNQYDAVYTVDKMNS